MDGRFQITYFPSVSRYPHSGIYHLHFHNLAVRKSLLVCKGFCLFTVIIAIGKKVKQLLLDSQITILPGEILSRHGMFICPFCSPHLLVIQHSEIGQGIRVYDVYAKVSHHTFTKQAIHLRYMHFGSTFGHRYKQLAVANQVYFQHQTAVTILCCHQASSQQQQSN